MLSLFLPERCIHCEQPTGNARGIGEDALSHYLCPVCTRILSFHERPGEQFIRDQFEAVSSGFSLVHSRTEYWFTPESPVQSIVHSFKYSGMPKLARHFGTRLAELVPPKTEVIVPVPLHRTRMAERGYNQAEELARGIVHRTNILLIPALKRTRPTPSQTKLSISERVENMRGAFTLTRQSQVVHGKHVVLIDDVMTTGSTLASAVEALLPARPKSISIMTLAVAQDRL